MARSSYSTSRKKGGSATYQTKVDRDPFYRTNGIFNGVFKKKFKLVPDSQNATDCKERIYVNFGETMPSRIVSLEGPGKSDNKSVYKLDCGHNWEGNAGHPTDGSKYGMCWECGAHQAYLGFEHEWQHIVFKSDIPAQMLFAMSYADQLLKNAPGVDRVELIKFLKLLVNAFDDIRCNSLWEKIYPGSAEQIWDRWERLTKLKSDLDTNFLHYVFAVAFDVDTPNSAFEPMRQDIKWAVEKVKYRGFANMLLTVRFVVENCVTKLLDNLPKKKEPPPPTPPSPQDQQNAQDQQPSDGSSQPQGAQGQDDDGDSDNSAGGSDDRPAQGQSSGSSPSSDIQGSSGGQEDTSKALSQLVAGASPLDDGEHHLDPDIIDIDNAKKSQGTQAMIAKALSSDVDDKDDLDQRMPTGVPDPDMQATIDHATMAISQKTPDSQLTSNAKAIVTIIDVPAHGIDVDKYVTLSDETKSHIARMRATFFKAMGKQKAMRAASGSQIDVQAYMQYKLTRQDPEVFVAEEVQQGFSYSIVCDMSGSMSGTFPQVAQAAEMLREALDFPFVRGDVWGFRGGEEKEGEVWMYRYAHDVRGYLGKGWAKGFYGGKSEYQVRCGGITPMNTAINITVQHQYRHVSEGMAKRMFLLTDGSPLQTRVSGGFIHPDALRKFVATEVKRARTKGIQVYALVIGEHAISEDDCAKMFGPRQYWRIVQNNDVGKVLSSLVIDNFKKYLIRRS